MTEHATVTCELFDESIEAYLDAELDAGAAVAFESHRAACESCAAELAWASRARASLRQLPQLGAPASVVAGVLATAREESEARSRARPGWGWLGARPALAAIGVALLLAIALLAILDRGAGRGPRELALDDPAVVRATLETKLALAHFARANRRVGRGLSEDLLRERVVRPAVRSLTRSSPSDRQSPTASPVNERG